MGRHAVKLNLSDKVNTLIKKELQRRTLENHFVLRMKIVLQCSMNQANSTVAKQLGCSEKTVYLWRDRWIEKSESLAFIESSEDPKTDKILISKIKEILSDNYRSGAPSRLNETEKIRILALACEKPEDHNIPVVEWTHSLLSYRAKELDIKISASHVGRLIKKRHTSA